MKREPTAEDIVPDDAVFTITYWGVTGTQPAPLRPADVTEKIVRAVEHLARHGRLADLGSGPNLSQAVRERIDELPFRLRSTYGGNTTCVEVQTPDALIIIDCGSGLRELGSELSRRWNDATYRGERRAHVLISHPHIDHTFGIPYASPYFDARNHFTLWTTRRVLDSFRAVLSPESPLCNLYFPPNDKMMPAFTDRREIDAGADFTIGSTRVRTYALNHPGGCLAFRLDNAARSFVFASDHEQPEVPDCGLAGFAADADLLYLDGQYLTSEYEGREAIPGGHPMARQGWGHSTAEACVATAVAARAGLVHVGHREPRRPDEQTAALERYLQLLLRDELHRQGRMAYECTLQIPHESMTVRV
jgi:phosphoribosyl 1,2-cyclic phosphodiesterase